MTDEAKAKSELARERRARRTEWEDAEALKRLDRRATRRARWKKEDVHIYLTSEARAMAEAIADRLNYGRGMSLSEFIEYLIRRYAHDSPEAREAYKAWRAEREVEAP